jgi:hypothetical protein
MRREGWQPPIDSDGREEASAAVAQPAPLAMPLVGGLLETCGDEPPI